MGVTANIGEELNGARNSLTTQITSRNDLYEEQAIDDEETKEDSARMDAIMRQMFEVASVKHNEEEGEEEEEMEEELDIMETPNVEQDQDNNEEAFSFRLFASEPLAEVNIKNTGDNTDDLSKAVAEQQVIEFDDSDPELLARVSQVAVDFDTIIQQSYIPYPAMKFSRRVVHILENGNPVKTDGSIEKPIKKKRPSKKCRDFQKAVKDGKIQLKLNMRNPQTPGGWPGWPGHHTKVAIIKNDIIQTPRKRMNYSEGRGGRGGIGGNTRGGFRGRGRGRGF